MDYKDYFDKKTNPVNQEVQKMIEGEVLYLMGWREDWVSGLDVDIKFCIKDDKFFVEQEQFNRPSDKQYFDKPEDAITWFTYFATHCDSYDKSGNCTELY